MAKGFLHLHLLVIALFTLSMIFKTMLLMMGNLELLGKFRAKTKILEMIFGTLILLTGGFLLVKTGNTELYMIVKIIIILAVIPLGIIGFKKNNKMLANLATLLLLYAVGIASTRSLSLNIGREKPASSIVNTTEVSVADSTAGEAILEQNKSNSTANAQQVYTQLCTTCHGSDGKQMLNGAKDLSISKLSVADKAKIISGGKNLMPGFEYQLSEADIQALAEYTETLKK